jgi:hypothetical protein
MTGHSLGEGLTQIRSSFGLVGCVVEVRRKDLATRALGFFADDLHHVAAGGNKRSLGAKAPEIALRYIFLYPPSLYTRRRPDQTSGLEMHRPRFSKESSLAVARQSPSSA